MVNPDNPMDRILIPELPLRARVGVEERERAVPQPIVLEVELRLDLRPAGRSDSVSNTIDYEAVCGRLEELVADRSFCLIETIAEEVASRLVRDFPAQSVRVAVRKPRALAARGVPYAAVEIERSRDD